MLDKHNYEKPNYLEYYNNTYRDGEFSIFLLKARNSMSKFNTNCNLKIPKYIKLYSNQKNGQRYKALRGLDTRGASRGLASDVSVKDLAK